jgi:putative transposase
MSSQAVVIQVEVPDTQFYRARTAHGITGVDLGIKAVATLSSGESIQGPKPLKSALRRLKICARRISRKIESAKVQAGFAPNPKLPKGTRLPISNNRSKSAATLARHHPRIAHACLARRCNTRQNALLPGWLSPTVGIQAVACVRSVIGKTKR